MPPKAAVDPIVATPERGFVESLKYIYDRFKTQIAVIGATAVAGVGPGCVSAHEIEQPDGSTLTTHPYLGSTYTESLPQIGSTLYSTSAKPVNYRLPSLQWPVKPFLGPHQIRSTFGEPRAHITDLPVASERPHYIWHNLKDQTRIIPKFNRRPHVGVDIPAADNTPVYSITYGTVSGISSKNESVNVGYVDYVHLDRRRVRNGQRVKKGTLLGYIRPKAEHLHLSMKDNGSYVNPLTYRRLAGYRDTLPPDVNRVFAVTTNGKPYESGDGGQVEVFVDAIDRNNGIEADGETNRRTGVYEMNYVLQDPVTERIVSRGEVFKFDGLTHPNKFALVHHPLSQRIRPPMASERPDTAQFYYRLTNKGSFQFPKNRTYTLIVGVGDAHGNRAVYRARI